MAYSSQNLQKQRYTIGNSDVSYSMMLEITDTLLTSDHVQ